MSDERKGGIALIAGAAGGVFVMILHPTGHDLFAPEQFERVAGVASAVHALAIASMPVAFLGGLALSLRLASADRLALAALVVYGFALAAGMSAAAIDGFATISVARRMAVASREDAEEWQRLLAFSSMLNQAFAKILAVASSVAILLWSASILKTHRLPAVFGIFGALLGAAIALAILSGNAMLDAHGFGLIVFTQSVWFGVAGALLWRLPAQS